MTDAGATLTLPDGREAHWFDTGAVQAPVVVWHHGTPSDGRIYGVLREAAVARGIRVISVARPGYPGSTRRIGRTVADSARDVLAVLDAAGVERFAAVGSSGGGPHALALAAVAGERATGVATFASLAPYDDDPEWFEGMADPSALEAAVRGLEARTRHDDEAEFDPAVFSAADWAALQGDWAEMGADAQATGEAGNEGAVDDDRAFVTDWGVDVRQITASVLIVHGDEDRMVPAGHATRLLCLLPDATSWWFADDGHVSGLRALGSALDWLLEHDLSSPSRGPVAGP
ncbi:alpha/beta fold hydrolase [Gryllotalpicola reticulitermitis]|uniref:Alpha/beta fold hydrolase n=1 Tax=Gryllotalpicola reticulitermitis TaxID=1184153 RepID=A0ABV8Q250_9MICO